MNVFSEMCVKRVVLRSIMQLRRCAFSHLLSALTEAIEKSV